MLTFGCVFSPLLLFPGVKCILGYLAVPSKDKSPQNASPVKWADEVTTVLGEMQTLNWNSTWATTYVS